MIKITKENIEAYRTYYKTQYSIFLYDSSILLTNKETKNFDKVADEEIYKRIDKKLESAIGKNSRLNMARYITGGLKNIKLVKLDIDEKVKLAKENSAFKVSLIRYFQNNLELKINLMNCDEKRKEELKDASYSYVVEAVNNYFENNLTSDICSYMNNMVFRKFCIDNGIKTNDKEVSLIIDTKDKSEKSKKALCDAYFEKYSNNVLKNIFTNKQYEKFIKYYINKLVDSYVESDNNNSIAIIILNYLKYNIFNSSEENLLIKYNKLFDDKYEEVVEYLFNKYKLLPYKVLSDNSLSDNKALLAELSMNLKYYIIEYLEYTKNEKTYRSCEVYIKHKTNEYIKEKTKNQFGFDIEKAKNSSLEDKEEQLQILKEICFNLKSLCKEKYVFYADNESVDKKIDEIYDKCCNMYIDNNSTKNPRQYISTVLNQYAKSYANKSLKLFNKNHLEDEIIIRSLYIISKYVKVNKLNDEEAKLFNDYVLFRVNKYIHEGCYKESIDSLLYKIIREYDVKKELEYTSKSKVIKPPFKK